MSKKIILCADDYGKSENISTGILNLLQKKRLSATSCLVNGDDWQRAYPFIKPLATQADIGLHFNLTEGRPLSKLYRDTYGDEFKGLKWLMLAALSRRLKLEVIKAECEAQLNYFMETMDVHPSHIDGHQHVHQFPVIRDALVAIYEKYLANSRTYLRLVNGHINFQTIISNYKKIIIYAMGAKVFGDLLRKHSIPYNTSFSGIYPFKQSHNYRDWFNQFLNEISDGGLIMCHAGLSCRQDDMSNTRQVEYDYLMSNGFTDDLQAKKIELTNIL